jgi:hypothetical protein
MMPHTWMVRFSIALHFRDQLDASHQRYAMATRDPEITAELAQRGERSPSGLPRRCGWDSE